MANRPALEEIGNPDARQRALFLSEECALDRVCYSGMLAEDGDKSGDDVCDDFGKDLSSQPCSLSHSVTTESLADREFFVRNLSFQSPFLCRSGTSESTADHERFGHKMSSQPSILSRSVTTESLKNRERYSHKLSSQPYSLSRFWTTESLADSERFDHKWSSQPHILSRSVTTERLADRDRFGHTWSSQPCFLSRSVTVESLVDCERSDHTWSSKPCLLSESLSNDGLSDPELVGSTLGARTMVLSRAVSMESLTDCKRFVSEMSSQPSAIFDPSSVGLCGPVAPRAPEEVVEDRIAMSSTRSSKTALGLNNVFIAKASPSDSPQGPPEARATTGVVKETIRCGDGKTSPLAGDNVLIHYSVQLASNGKLVDCTHESGHPTRFTVGSRRVFPGLSMGLKSMSLGERATLHVPSQLAYGKKGFGNGIVPPDADLTVTISLLVISNP